MTRSGGTKKRVALNPDHADTLNNLATALMAKGQREEAIKHYERAFALNPRLRSPFIISAELFLPRERANVRSKSFAA